MNRRDLAITTKFTTEDSGTITGVAWPFGAPDRVGDVIQPGSFKSARAPLPMLWGHDGKEVIGQWTAVGEDATGFKVVGRLNLKVQRAQEVRELLKAGDVTSLSIGFVPTDYQPREGGGWTIRSLDLLEISVVAIPANPGAAVTSIKSNTERTPVDPILQKLQTDVVTLRGHVSKLRSAPAASGGALNEAKAVAATAVDRVKELEARLDGIELKAGRPVFGSPKVELTAVEKAALIITGLLKNNEEPHKSAHAHLDDLGHKAFALELERTAKALNSSSAVAGGILVPADVSAEIIDILRPRTSFLRGNPVRIPMPNGTFSMPAAATGAVATYTTEGQASSLTEQTFAELKMAACTLSAVIPVTNDLLRMGLGGVQSFVMRDLTNAMAERMDTAAYLGDGASGNPIGLFNRSGITTIAAVNTTTPTLAQVDSDARKLINALVSANVNLASAAWVIPATTLGYLADVRDGNGGLIWPGLDGPNPRFKGLPVLSTTNLPTNLGAGSDETRIALIAWDAVVFGEAGPLQLAVSNEASLEINGATISLFQRRMHAILAVMQHDFGLRYPKAVAVLTGVRWGK